MLNGTLTIVPGDNLASQYLGGYKSLASALRKCRQCMAVNTDMQTKVPNNLTNQLLTLMNLFVSFHKLL